MSFEQDFHYSQIVKMNASCEEDRNFCVDAWINDIPISYRRRRVNCPGDITLRSWRKSGAMTEVEKIKNEMCKAVLFVFDFLDRVIFCGVDSIRENLIKGNYEELPNRDGTTKFVCINLEDLHYLEWKKR